MRKILAERIKQERIALGKTQGEMAALLDISRANYGYYENGKNLPPIDKVLTLAHYFGVSVDYLVGNEREAKKLNIAAALQQIIDALEETKK